MAGVWGTHVKNEFRHFTESLPHTETTPYISPTPILKNCACIYLQKRRKRYVLLFSTKQHKDWTFTEKVKSVHRLYVHTSIHLFIHFLINVYSGLYINPTNAKLSGEDFQLSRKKPSLPNDQFEPKLSSFSGANYFDRDTNLLYIVVRGSEPIDIRTTPVIQVSCFLIDHIHQ